MKTISKEFPIDNDLLFVREDRSSKSIVDSMQSARVIGLLPLKVKSLTFFTVLLFFLFFAPFPIFK